MNKEVPPPRLSWGCIFFISIVETLLSFWFVSLFPFSVSIWMKYIFSRQERYTYLSEHPLVNLRTPLEMSHMWIFRIPASVHPHLKEIRQRQIALILILALKNWKIFQHLPLKKKSVLSRPSFNTTVILVRADFCFPVPVFVTTSDVKKGIPEKTLVRQRTGEISIRDAFLSCQTDLLLLKAAAVRKQKMAFLLCHSLFLMALFLMPPTELT